MIRINKYLVLCGLGSRRKVETLITEGRIRINGEIITSLAKLVNETSDEVHWDNKPIRPIKSFIYLMMNKPRGYITAVEDASGRPVVMDLVPEKYKRVGVVPVGRLDKDTEGLLLLTNDGTMAYRLTHPRFEIPKEYRVQLDRPLNDVDMSRIEKGIYLYGKKTNPAKLEQLGNADKTYKMTITEGKKRQIRLTFQQLHYNVKKLTRLAIGPVRLTGVNRGQCRLLREREVNALSKITHSQIK